MLRWMILPLPLMGLLLALPGAVPACSLCGAALRQAPTFRQEAALETAKVILIGTAENPQFNSRTTDLRITDVLRSDSALKNKKVISVKQYLPVSDPKNPPRYLVFCDVYKGEFDPFRGVPLKSADSADYARKVMKLDPKDSSAAASRAASLTAPPMTLACMPWRIASTFTTCTLLFSIVSDSITVN